MATPMRLRSTFESKVAYARVSGRFSLPCLYSTGIPEETSTRTPTWNQKFAHRGTSDLWRRVRVDFALAKHAVGVATGPFRLS